MSAPTPHVVRIGTRQSQLAMFQAELVQQLIRDRQPQLDTQLVGLSTVGDKVLDVPLSAFSSKGVFTKELDIALLNSTIDVAVHCMKDLPTILPKGLQLFAVLPRGTTYDAVVMHTKHAGKTLDQLPKGAVIGTSSLRRIATLARNHPDLVCKDVRGNVNTRLRKLDEGQFDALILAAVGLQRIGLGDRISQILDDVKYSYAVGQGALGVVGRDSDHEMKTIFSVLNDVESELRCAAERSMLRVLEGGCKVPISVRSQVDAKENKLSLSGAVTSLDGKRFFSSTVSGSPNDAQQLGIELGRQILKSGADAVLAEIRAEADRLAIEKDKKQQASTQPPSK